MGAQAQVIAETKEVIVEETVIEEVEVEEVDLKELAKELVAEIAIKLEVLEVTLASM